MCMTADKAKVNETDCLFSAGPSLYSMIIASFITYTYTLCPYNECALHSCAVVHYCSSELQYYVMHGRLALRGRSV